MFFILSKIFFFLLLPLTWIIILAVLVLVVRKPRLKQRLFLAVAVLLLFFTNPFLANEAWLWWEVPARPVAEVENYDVGIVLTGISNPDKSPHDRVHLNKGADRLLHALQLYREGRFSKFLITGGSGAILDKHQTEADELKRILLLAKVPEEDILIENKSRNTRENAVFTKEMLEQHPQLQKCLLITSAFHMRRSMACFEKAGVEVDPFSTDFYTSDRKFTPDALLMPSAESLHMWQKLTHEIAGFLIYKVMGYA